MRNARYITMGLPALLVGGVFLLVAVPKPSDPESPAIERFLGADGKEVKSGDFFLRPFITDFSETGMSLDGGKHPVGNHTLPHVEFGELGEDGDVRRLQLAMLVDWTEPESRNAYKMIHDLYAGGDAKGLPAIGLYLLPVHGSDPGKSLHEAIITVHLGSNRIDTLPGVLAGLAAGVFPADAGEVLAHVSNADPDLAARWESLTTNLKESFADAFRRASAQQRHSSARLGDGRAPQFIVFDSVLVGAPSRSSLADFLGRAASRQHAFLNSPEGAVPLVIARGCNCNDPSHDHSNQTDIPQIPPAGFLTGSDGSPPQNGTPHPN